MRSVPVGSVNDDEFLKGKCSLNARATMGVHVRMRDEQTNRCTSGRR